MPWIQEHKPLHDNLNLAKKRLNNFMNKLEKNGCYNEYDQVFQEWLKEGIIDSGIGTSVHYLPHRHVVKLSSTRTKLRLVFNAYAREKDRPSLNQCLEKGISLLTLILSLLINSQISFHLSDRNFLRFLWYDKDKRLRVYRHVRVVFGVTCSPFLLNAVVKHHLNTLLEDK